MDRNKRARKPLRTAVSKTITESEFELAKEVPDCDVLQEKRRKLEDLEMRLAEADTKILEELLEGNDEDYETEFHAVEEYTDKIRTIRMKISKAMGQGVTPVAVPIDSSNESSRKFKLPKIELKKFGGDLSEWLGWWSQFEKIHTDDTLHPSDKFQYLVQATTEGSRARRLVDGYPQTAQNYPKAVSALQDRFGDKIMLTEMYVRRLAGLVIANASKPKAASLSFMYDELESSLRSLESLGVTAEQSAAFLYPLVESSLPQEVLRVWQRSPLSGYDAEEEKRVDERLSSLMKFLRSEVRGEERLSFVTAGIQTEKRIKPKSKSSLDTYPTAAGLLTMQRKCIFCEKNHESRDCSKVSGWTLQEKKRKLEEKKGCYSCLKPGHNAKACRTFVKCQVCGKRHTVILCPEIGDKSNLENKANAEASSVMSSISCSQIILQTIRLRIIGPKDTGVVRALLDTGSQRSFIQQSCATKLGLKPVSRERLTHAVFGGGITRLQSHPVFKVTFIGLNNNARVQVNVLGQATICNYCPPVSNNDCYEILRQHDIVISDTVGTKEKIEVLIGADYYPFLLTGQQLKVSESLMAIETKVGWTLIGNTCKEPPYNSCGASLVSNCISSNEIQNLWKLDSLGIRDPVQVKGEEEKEMLAYEDFLENVSRDELGRYVVGLPWVHTPHNFQSNKSVAEKRLNNLTRKLYDNADFQVYENVFVEWEKEELIEMVADSSSTGFYLPHRPVWKPESSTTPVRPVFDASCRYGSNPSLNDLLYKGPNFMEMIPAILYRFRRYRIGLSADIRKAFQTLVVKTSDRRYLRFLWWNKDGTLKELQHTRVVFGVKSSPFLLAAVLRLHLTTEKEDVGTAAKLLRSLYVDNCVSSVATLEEYEKFKLAATCILSQAKMELRQWEFAAGDETGVGLLSGSKCGLGSGGSKPQDVQKESTTILGLKWDKYNDTLSCIIPRELKEKVTKKYMLSIISKVFDPLGMLAPVTLVPKLLLQEAWISKAGWDEELPLNISKPFVEWTANLEHMEKIEIPRHAFLNGNESEIQFHVFTDACAYGYGAVIYIRSCSEEKVRTQFLTAKARVAPLKRPTIPRMELLGATLGARLYKQVATAYEGMSHTVHLWSDSTCVLAWLKGSAEWGTFVKNRVDHINEIVNPTLWNYVPGALNPADFVSRGGTVTQLLMSNWLTGPPWLKLGSQDWPVKIPDFDQTEVEKERRKQSCILTSANGSLPWYVFTSGHAKNVRIMAWILRFIRKSQKKPIESDCLKSAELNVAEIEIFKLVQTDAFPGRGELVEGVRVLRDSNGIIRVVTKLLNRQDTNSFKFPVLLPSSHQVVQQFIRFHHVTSGHAGVQYLMGKLREAVWVIHSRKTIKQVVGSCFQCKRFQVKATTTQPAPLPIDRVQPTKAFDVTGIDLAGPLFLKGGSKCWVVLFTCAMFRCTHLEIVLSLSTDAFLLALQKFVCRRGRPRVIWSDNGTNFKGCNRAFKTLNWKEIEESTAVFRIQWKFIPPSGPWWGGWWERLVRLLKDMLKRMLGFKKLTMMQLEAMLCVAETVMNERPLTYVSSDQEDLIPLSPQMFLHGLSSSKFPEIELLDGQSLAKRANCLQQMRRELIDRFRKEYLSQLIHNTVGVQGSSIRVGEVVLIGVETKKRCLWPIGRVVELFPGKDGQARVARVKVKEGYLVRPVKRLYRMEVTEVVPEDEKTAREFQNPENVKTRSGRIVKKPDRFTV